jgi:hypothetical protein
MARLSSGETGQRLPAPDFRFADQPRWTAGVGRRLDRMIRGLRQVTLGQPRPHTHGSSGGGGGELDPSAYEQAELLALRALRR